MSNYTPVIIIGAGRSGTNMLRDILTLGIVMKLIQYGDTGIKIIQQMNYQNI